MVEMSTTASCGDFYYWQPVNPPPYYHQPYYYYELPRITNPIPFTRECHGCKGLGWIETKDGKPHICPICKGKGTIQDGNCTITWTFNELVCSG